jgi:hypothetical protein
VDPRVLVRKVVRWSALAVCALSVAAALAALSLRAYGEHRREKARSEFDARWGPLTETTTTTTVPDHENGARWLAAGGFAIMCSIEDLRFYGQLSDRSARGWSEAEMSRARWILHEQQNALGILLRSASFEAFNLGRNNSRAVYDEVHFLDLVRGLRLLALEARLAWYEGRLSDSVAALNALGRASDGLLSTPIIMASIVGSASARWSARAAAELVSDPCTPVATLVELRAALPSEDPIHRGNTTLAISVDEIAEEGLAYIEDLHDPSMGWSIPFWVSNRFLLEDLFVAEIIERWGRYLELCQKPAVSWPPDASTIVWGEGSWPRWIALSGSFTPNLLSTRARAQAASTELQQVRLAIDLRLLSPDGLDEEACDTVPETGPTALTGEPVSCSYDELLGAIVIRTTGAQDALSEHVAVENQASRFPAIEIPLDSRPCGSP